jgi:hypothetical protein
MQGSKDRTRETLLRENICLVFNLALKDAFFYNYTQVNVEAITNSLFFFSNATSGVLCAEAGVTAQDLRPLATLAERFFIKSFGVLHKRVYVTAQDLRPLATLAEKFFVKPFGRITLQIDGRLRSSYRISFQAKAAHWCYFLMSDNLRSLSRPAIIDTNGNGYFGTPVTASLPGNGDVPVFISKDPLALADTAARTFQLVDYSTTDADRYKVILSALPAPEVNRISNAGAALYENGNDYAEIFLY